jgi:hypothetical protein
VPRILKSILRRIGFIYETLLYFEKELHIEDIERQLALYDYSDVRLLTIEDFNLCVHVNQVMKDRYQLRLKSGYYDVYGIFKDNMLVYYSWISFKNIGLPFGFNEKTPLLKNEALLEDSFCDPKYRGRGFHAKVNILRLKRMLEKGKSKAIAIVLKGNAPAVKVQLKSGFKLKGKIFLIKVFSMKRIKHLKING